LAQYKDKYYVDEILRQLELEREKTAKLSIQLQQQITRLLVARVFTLLISLKQYRTQHMVKSFTLNPYMSLCNLKLCTHIWSTNITFRPPTYIGLFGPSWCELSPYG